MLGDAIAGRHAERCSSCSAHHDASSCVRARPVGGGSAGALVMIEDITERARIDAVRTDFVANISHELKTPVGAMTCSPRRSPRPTTRTIVHRLSTKVVQEADRLSRTIDDLLELSRIELGGEVVREPVERRRRRSRRRSNGSVGLPSATGSASECGPFADDLKVLGDRRQLVSALGNLVENAVKYSERGGEVEVSAPNATATASN